MSILAEDGRCDWDDPVTKHLPEFQMYDPWVTREVTLRDLVTHRAGLGLGQGDLMWWPATEFTRREIVRGIRYLKPVSSLRSRYAYSNVMYVAAGEVVAQVSGRSWDDFLRERIFVPLGMSRTNTSVAAFAVERRDAAPAAQGPAEPGRPDAGRQLRGRRRHQLERLRHGPLAADAARVRPPGRERGRRAAC